VFAVLGEPLGVPLSVVFFLFHWGVVLLLSVWK